jgi:iron-sulfur cluster repair protein YtfE (RIC family)
MSTTHTYPDQLMLPGQAAAPGGPVDMMVMYVLHHAFRRDLNRFTLAAEATPIDDLDTWRALDARWGRFFERLHHHHSGEDAGIWPFLIARADDDERATLEAMEEEHSHVDPLLTSCADGFATLAGSRVGVDAEDVRAALKVRLAATRDALSRHLAHEESEAMVILQRHMTQAEWEQIEEEQFRGKESFRDLLFAVSWCAEDVAADKMAEIFATIGTPFKVIWWLGRRSFRKQERRAFKYAGVR